MLALAGCNSSPTKDAFSDLVDGLHAKRSPLRGERAASRSLTTSYQGISGFAGASHIGSGSFVSGAAPGVAAKAMAGGGQGFELNLVNAPIAEAAKAVLGDILGVNYVLDPRVTGTVTLQTSAPVSREALTGILEAALAVNNATIVNRGGVYQIVPLSEALSATPAVSVPSVSPSGPGVLILHNPEPRCVRPSDRRRGHRRGTMELQLRSGRQSVDGVRPGPWELVVQV
ncbi:hypothetical protein [Nitratireductor sp. ZSWI3]|uniref:hypothetical protein n=1 Tax=Nitratireductor sp. ZSWI3 TaxID=2966359 RepID=UPI00214FFD99|nr:hypothetical protein [Nitratireductor sp. ZSWI3]MCR4269483.1 hypothetical protein [Nitratireductor sp. ZSWI3]